VPIIRRNNCVYVTFGTCYSVWMTVWYAGAYAPAYQTVIHTEYHQEEQLCLCDTWYLLFCVDDCQVCRYQVSHKHSCFSWWWAHSHPKHVEIDKYIKNKYTKNKLCTKLAIFTKKPYQSIIPPPVPIQSQNMCLELIQYSLEYLIYLVCLPYYICTESNGHNSPNEMTRG